MQSQDEGLHGQAIVPSTRAIGRIHGTGQRLFGDRAMRAMPGRVAPSQYDGLGRLVPDPGALLDLT